MGIVAMYDDPHVRGNALGVPVFYGLVEAVVIATFLLISWCLGGTYAPPTDPLCKVLTTSYQHNAADSSQRHSVVVPAMSPQTSPTNASSVNKKVEETG